MRVTTFMKNNGLATLTAEENLDGNKIKYTVSQVFNPDTQAIELEFGTYAFSCGDVPKDVKERLTKKLAILLAEF